MKRIDTVPKCLLCDNDVNVGIHEAFCPSCYLTTEYVSEHPNPNNYDNTPEGDADYFEDYWQGDIDAFMYHEDMGDR